MTSFFGFSYLKKKSYWGFWLSRLGRRCSTRQAAHLLFWLAFSLFSQRLLRLGPSSWFRIPRPVRWVINPSRDPSRHHHYISPFWWWFHCITDHVTIQLPHRLTSWNVCVIIQAVLIKCSYVFNHCLYFFSFFLTNVYRILFAFIYLFVFLKRIFAIKKNLYISEENLKLSDNIYGAVKMSNVS